LAVASLLQKAECFLLIGRAQSAPFFALTSAIESKRREKSRLSRPELVILSEAKDLLFSTFATS